MVVPLEFPHDHLAALALYGKQLSQYGEFGVIYKSKKEAMPAIFPESPVFLLNDGSHDDAIERASFPLHRTEIGYFGLDVECLPLGF